MIYQTTVFVPWGERNVMELFDGNDDYICVAEDTRGKTYKSPTFMMDMKGEEDVRL